VLVEHGSCGFVLAPRVLRRTDRDQVVVEDLAVNHRTGADLIENRQDLVDVRVSGEELVANWFGWTNRTLEATAHPEDVPWGWRNYAYRGYLTLQGVDRRLLESRLPAAMFYNLIVAAHKP